MLLHYTNGLAAKLPNDHFRNSSPTLSQDERTSLGEWQGHLLILARRQCVLFCHNLPGYVLFFQALCDAVYRFSTLASQVVARQACPVGHAVRSPGASEMPLGPLSD